MEPHGSSDVAAELRDNNGVEEDRDDNSDVAAVPDDNDAVVVLACSDDVEHRGSSDVAVHHGSVAAVVEPQSAELPLDLLVTEPDPYSSWLGLTALSIP